MRLDGKTAMITGGVSGIGKATVLEFARCGAKVICADINAEKGAELEQEAAAQKLPVEYVKIDMADRDTVRACAAQPLEREKSSAWQAMPDGSAAPARRSMRRRRPA